MFIYEEDIFGEGESYMVRLTHFVHAVLCLYLGIGTLVPIFVHVTVKKVKKCNYYLIEMFTTINTLQHGSLLPYQHEVRYDGIYSDPFPIKRGVKQDCILVSALCL